MFCCWGEQYIVKTAHVLFFCIFNNMGLNIQMSYFFSLILNTDYVIAANMEYRCILMTSWRGVNQYVAYYVSGYTSAALLCFQLCQVATCKKSVKRLTAHL